MQPEPSDAHEITCRLPRRASTVPRARALLSAVLGSWSIDQEVLDTAELVLSELVTNALRARAPRDRQVGVRIAHTEEDGLLRLEVSDAGEGRPEVRSPGEDETGGRGLLLVEALTHLWGVEEREGGIGKTVWAEIKAPDITAVPTAVPIEREIAAVTLQPGDQVKLSGAWQTIRCVRGERSPSGGFVMVLALNDGPAVRVDAGAPVSVFRVATGRVTGWLPATHEAPVPLREVFDVSTQQRRSLVGSVSCRTRPASRPGRVGNHAHRHS